jgi:hypothetical protein
MLLLLPENASPKPKTAKHTKYFLERRLSQEYNLDSESSSKERRFVVTTGKFVNASRASSGNNNASLSMKIEVHSKK